MIRMNIIGNAVAEPKTYTTNSGKTVANFTVAINQRTKSGENNAVYVEVAAWEKLGDIAIKYVQKGTKVYIDGIPSARAYKNKSGEAAANLCLMANSIELLSGKPDAPKTEAPKQQTSFPAVDDDDCPF